MSISIHDRIKTFYVIDSSPTANVPVPTSQFRMAQCLPLNGSQLLLFRVEILSFVLHLIILPKQFGAVNCRVASRKSFFSYTVFPHLQDPVLWNISSNPSRHKVSRCLYIIAKKVLQLASYAMLSPCNCPGHRSANFSLELLTQTMVSFV